MMDTVRNCNEQLTITRGEVTAEKVETAIANNYGNTALREETFATTNISVKAEENGAKGVSSENQQARSWSDLDCGLVAQIAADRARRVIHARTIKPGTMPIIWRNKLFASVLRIMFSRTLTADAIQKSRSPWRGKIGSRIASETFQLVDDGTRRNGLGTRLFDDEGTAHQRVQLVNNGVLQGYLYDSYTANRDHRKSTGNASREYHNLPTPTPNNLTLQPGTAQSEELFSDVKHGLYLIESIGAWLSNPISGDLSATATNAFLIEHGELTQPVKGVVVTGNFFDILQNRLELIANDTQNLGSTYAPSVKISEMTVISDNGMSENG
jgi:PmbA protein